MAVAITTDPELEAGGPRVLFDGVSSGEGTAGWRRYDLSPGGDRFVVARPVDESRIPGQIHVVQNWFEELKRQVQTER